MNFKLELIFLLFLLSSPTSAQSIFDRTLTLNSKGERLEKVLASIEEQADFSFSYKSDILPLDSLIIIRKEIITVADALDNLLGHRYEYHQYGNFIIIRYAPMELTLLIHEASGNSETYTIRGQIIDKQTERSVSQASIYESHLLISEVSDDNGNFSIKLRNLSQPISLTVRKENYKSVTTNFLEDVNITNQVTVKYEKFVTGNLSDIENTWLGNALITTRQKIQSLNIGGFLSDAPYQVSLVPGINTHGLMSGQIVNKFSFNAIGAYSAGVEGTEIGLGFNIDKSNVQYLQIGGIFNLVGGKVTGAQIAGLFNYDISSLKGTQLALIYNRLGRTLCGVQLAGIYNRVNKEINGVQLSLGLNAVGGNINGFQASTLNLVSRSTRGIQAAIIGNIVNGKSTGFQASCILNLNQESDGANISLMANITSRKSRGIQAGFLNYAGNLRGLQLGVINITNNNDGYSIGLINVALKGYHKVYICSNESMNLNLIYKGGSSRLYNSLIFSTNLGSLNKIYTGGLGFGKEIGLSRIFYLNPELSMQYVYQGSWKNLNLLNKYNFALTIKINKWLGIQGGPSLNFYYTDQQQTHGNFELLQHKHRDFSFRNSKYTGWVGWHAGIILF